MPTIDPANPSAQTERLVPVNTSEPANNRISYQPCDSTFPAVSFVPGNGNASNIGATGITWQDDRDGNWEIYARILASKLDQNKLKLATGLVFDPKTGKLTNISCSNGPACNDTTNPTNTTTALLTQAGGSLGVNTVSRIITLTASQGSIDFQTSAITPGATLSILNGLNTGKTFYVSRLLTPSVAELEYVDGASADTGFAYSITKENAGLGTCEIRVTCNKGSSLFPDIVADSFGRFHIVFQDSSEGNYELFYSQIYPTNIGKASCLSSSANTLNVFGFAQVPSGTLGSVTITTQGTSTTFMPTGPDGVFFSFGNLLLPTPVTAIDTNISSRTGLHRIFKDIQNDGSWVGVSKAQDRTIWEEQYALLSIPPPTPGYVATAGNLFAGMGDFGDKYTFKYLAFIAQTPPDKSIELRKVALPLKPKCLPNVPANAENPLYQNLQSAPLKPVPPSFSDPVDLAGVFNSPLTQVDSTVPDRFTIEGDNSGTVFTNILTDNGRGQLSRFVFNCNGKPEEQNLPKFILGQVRCGEELCALMSNNKSTNVTPTGQYRIRLQVWQGSDYRLAANQITSAQINGAIKLIEKEFLFDPGQEIQTFVFKEGEVKVPDGKFIFFVPIAGEGVEFFIEGVGSGNSVWNTDNNGNFTQYYVPFTLPPTSGLNIPVYYDGILSAASSGADSGGSGEETDGSKYSINLLSSNNNIWGVEGTDYVRFGGTGILDIENKFTLTNGGKITTLKIPITLYKVYDNNALATEVINISVVKTSDSSVMFSTTINASILPVAPTMPPNGTFDVNSYILRVPISKTLLAGEYAIVLEPRNNSTTSSIVVKNSSVVEYRLPISSATTFIQDYQVTGYSRINGAEGVWQNSSIAGMGINVDGTPNVGTTSTTTLTGTINGQPASPTFIVNKTGNITITDVEVGTPNRPTIIGVQTPIAATVLLLKWSWDQNSLPSDCKTFAVSYNSQVLQTIIRPTNTNTSGAQFFHLFPANATTFDGITIKVTAIDGHSNVCDYTEITAASSPSTSNTTATINSASGTVDSYTITPPLRLTKSTGNNLHPRLAIDSKDNIWVTYHSDRTGNYDVYVGRYFCGKWATSANGGIDFRVTKAGDNGKNAQFPNIAIDELGDAHIVYQSDDTEDGKSEIFYVRTSGNVFAPPKRITSSKGEALMPDIAISTLAATTSGTSTCSTKLGLVAPPQGIGKTVITFHDNRFNQYEIMAAEKVNGEWNSSGQGGTDIRITQAPGNSLFPRISADHIGNFRIVYQSFRRGLDNPCIFMSRFLAKENKWDSTAQGGADIVILPTDTFHDLHADIDVDMTNGCYVVFHSDRFQAESGVKNEVMGKYFAKLDAPFGLCGPICTDVEAYVQTELDILDPFTRQSIDVTNIPYIDLEITSPGATFYRVSIDDGDFSDWAAFQPTTTLDTVVVPFTLTGGAGEKKICVQVQDATTIGFPVCKKIMFQAALPGFQIDFYKDDAMTTLLDTYQDKPVSPEGDIFIKITASNPMIYAPTFDVISKGVRLAFNQETTAVSGYSGAGTIGEIISQGQATAFSAYAGSVFKGRFNVKKDDGFFYLDGVARIVPHGEDLLGQTF